MNAKPATTSELLAAILGRAKALKESCNSYHLNHQGGVLRGLVWAYTGKDPGVIDDCEKLGQLLGGEIIEDEDGNISFVANPGTAF